MNDLHLRPRTVSELVDAAFTLYRQRPLDYIVVAALAMAPVLVLNLLLPDPARLRSMPGLLILVQVVNWIGYVLISGVVQKIGSEAYLGGQPDVGRAVRQVLPKVPALLWSSVLKAPLYMLGVLALVVGTLYVTARWFAVGIVIVLEDKDVLDAFARSTELSRDRKRHILNTILLAGIIYLVVALGIGAIAGVFHANRIVVQVVTSAFTVVTYPIVALTMLVLYYDARIRGEGFDLERMADALDAPATPVP